MAIALSSVRCPNKDCNRRNVIKTNDDHYLFVVCSNCGKNFWANPKDKRTKENLMAISKNPDDYTLIQREQIDELIDVALLFKDIEYVKYLTNVKISNPDTKYFISKMDENELHPLVEVE